MHSGGIQTFHLLNDLGNINIERCKILYPKIENSSTAYELFAEHRSRASRYFERSIEQNNNQLRAYYNLAWLDIRPVHKTHKEDIHLAINRLKDGLTHCNWEMKPVDEFTCNAQYNLACYLGKLLQ